MRGSRWVLAAGFVLLAPAPAVAATPAKVSFSGPARVAAGASATFTVSVKAGSKKLSKGTVALTLSTDRKADKRDRKLASRTVRNVKARKTSKQSLKVTIPVAAAPRAYRVFACLTVGKRVSCVNRALTVTRPVTQPAPQPLPQPAPAPAPTAVPTATPTATPTGTPTPVEPVVVTTEPPAPGPEDAPAADPVTVAPPLAPAEATSLEAATEFLYTGANPIQKGVAADTIELPRAAVLRGTVANRMSGPIGGVRVTVLDHPEYGRTATQADGGYDLAVNGGEPLTLVFEREGYIPAQRIVDVPWQDYNEVEPLVMVPYDPRGTRIDTRGSNVSAVRASTITDADGARTQTLLFTPGTSAEMEVGGSYQPLGQRFTVRSTEYTQGETGEQAMPGQLPPNTAYTYAVEFSVDEAVAAGATDVRFNQPVATYMENFLDLPVGTIVPVGWYDRERGRWIGAENGRVVRLLTGGVDTDGNGTADNAGIGAAERAKLAELYAPGQELWRTEVRHFTPWDHNYPYGPASDATPPGPQIGPRLLGGPDAKIGPAPNGPCPGNGSVVLCDSQVLAEYLPLAGSDELLVYRSDRVPGRLAERTIDIQLRSGSLSSTLEGIDLTVSVAGQVFKRSFSPAQSLAQPMYTYQWDGLDGYGRRVNGTQTATVQVGYRYRAVLQASSSAFASSWARVSGVPLSTSPARTDFTMTRTAEVQVAGFDARVEGLGGWTLSDHHAYDPESRTVLLGSGDYSATVATRIGALRPSGSGFDGPTGLAAAADGSVLVASTRTHRIFRIPRAGAPVLVAGSGGFGYRAAEDGGPAANARLSSPQGVAVDGADIYIADTQANRIRRVRGGQITTVAGGGAALGDGGAATAARLSGPTGVAVAPDGAIYVADTNQHRVRMIGTDGTITTVAGDGTPGFTGDGGPASGARLRGPAAVAVDDQGGLLISDAGNARVRRVGPDGIIRTFAGGGVPASGVGDGGEATAALLVEPLGLAIAPDGDVLIADAGAGRVRAVASGGAIRTVGGGGTEPRTADSPVTAIALSGPTGVAVRGDHSLAISEPTRDLVSTVAEPLPGFSNGDALIPSSDGGQVFQFNSGGRHLRTRDALTGAVVRRFAYDANGRLTTVFDEESGSHAPLLTIERPNPATVRLLTRGGRVTTLALDAAGWLDSVTNPAGDVHQLAHGPTGLLTGEADAEGGEHEFGYDARGRLTLDVGPAGFRQQFGLELTQTTRTVTRTTGGGQVTTFKLEIADGEYRRTITEPNGGVTRARYLPSGAVVTILPDGTRLEQTAAPDPRFGLQAPFTSRKQVTTPGGRTTTTVGSRTFQMRDVSRLERLVETVTLNGRASTRTFQARPGDDGGTITEVTPTGRQSTSSLDNRGRVTSWRVTAGAQPVVTVYDDAHDGRIASQAHGARTSTFEYDARNRVTRETRTGTPPADYTYDNADRVLTMTRDGRVWRHTYDKVGRRTSLQTPTGRTTTFTHTASGKAQTLSLPSTSPFARLYTTDELPLSHTLPSGARTTSSYQVADARLLGRVDTAAGGGTVSSTAFTYFGDTRRPASEQWTAGAVTQRLETEYDGELTTKLAYTGAAEGTVTLTPTETGHQVASMQVAAGSGAPRTYALTRNNDRLLTAFGPYTVDRNPTTGLARGYADAADGTSVRTLDTQGYGEIDERSVVDDVNVRYSLQVQRDAAGRVSRREETIAGGAPIVRKYEYNSAGRLETVKDGADAVLESYVYDGEGDRLSALSSDHGAQTATYAAGTDLQTSAGPLALSFGADGFLQSRGGRAFSYGPSGELLSAETAAGTVTYAYDATGRLVRRALGVQRTTFLYANPDSVLEVTATVDQAGELTTYFYDDNGHLHAFDRGGTRYRVGADQVGTPRVIVAGDGAIAGRVDRDSFGRILASSGSVTIPFGFAGGIEDPDTGLVRFGLRDYDPQTGRWTSRDPSFHAGSRDNLYAYADSSPADQRDPTGLWSVGISGYLGIGGGVSFSFENGGWGYCGEMGVGLGVAAEADLLAKPSEGDSKFGEIGGTAGKVGGSLALEQDDCPPNGSSPIKVTGKISGGPVSIQADNQDGLSGLQLSVDAIELKAQGKAGKKRCVKFSTTWW